MDGQERSKKSKHDILEEYLQGRVVGGTLAQLANYADLFARMNEAVFLLDKSSFRILECNPAALKLFKMTEGDLLGRPLTEILGHELKPGMKAEITWKNAAQDQFVFEVAAAPLKILDYIEVVQLVARDVTEVKQVQRELEEMNAVLRKLSTTDEMTALKNLRYFKEVLASVHNQALNFHKEYGVIFLDVDHFKKFNDRNGHPAGDQVLKQVAQILRDCARSQDLPARYGGEEFVVLCRDSDLKETYVQAEKIRAAIYAYDFPCGEHQPMGRVSASIGVAAFPVSGDEATDIVKRADDALYEAKQGGRNRVAVYVPGTTEDSKPKKSA
ncbi:MAG: sensor domain-containing diguanylate cyclase [Bdellovibrionales bacterium]|nr:sensor domain-containing diguanylate cyclase [Bdellovibrionales bacterium]